MSSDSSVTVLQAFWCTSLFIGITSMIALVWLCFRVVSSIRSKKQLIRISFVRGYIPLVVGDLLLLCAFVPFDAAKSLGVASRNPSMIGSESCHAFSSLFVTGVFLSACGTSFASFQAWQIFKRSMQLRSDYSISVWIISAFVGCCLGIGALSFSVAYRGSLIGEFRHLHCAYLFLGDFRSGGPLIAVLIVNLFAPVLIFLALLRHLKAVMSSLASNNAIGLFRALARKIIGIYVVGWLPLFITLFAALTRRQMPFEFDALVLLVLKIKPFMDTMLIFSCTSLKADLVPSLMRRKSCKDSILTRFRNAYSDSRSAMKRAGPRRTTSQPIVVKRTQSQSANTRNCSIATLTASSSLPNVKMRCGGGSPSAHVAVALYPDLSSSQREPSHKGSLTCSIPDDPLEEMDNDQIVDKDVQ